MKSVGIDKKRSTAPSALQMQKMHRAIAHCIENRLLKKQVIFEQQEINKRLEQIVSESVSRIQFEKRECIALEQKIAALRQ